LRVGLSNPLSDLPLPRGTLNSVVDRPGDLSFQGPWIHGHSDVLKPVRDCFEWTENLLISREPKASLLFLGNVIN
jgi:hypothetical protein